MAQWTVEMGFNWEADSESTPLYLQWGAVSPNNTVTNLNNVTDGDTVRFVIYDVTGLDSGSGQASGAAPSLVSPWITSQAADEDTTASTPFSNFSTLQQAGLNSLGSTQSPTFNNQSFSAWQVSTDGTVGNAGCYLLSMTITVALSGTTKVFSVDPEMIVKP